jgi:hypothetical protein
MKALFDTIYHNRQKRSGILGGFTSDADLDRFPHRVELIGLCRSSLGDRRFPFVLHRCLRAAARLAPLNFRSGAIYEDHQRVGHEFLFADPLTALRFQLCHEAAMCDRPCPSLKL